MLMHVTIELKYGKLPELFETMPEVNAIVTAAGWHLRDALYFLNGRINTAVHIWELRDMNHYMEGVAALSAHPDFPRLVAALGDIFHQESIVFAERTPYAPAKP